MGDALYIVMKEQYERRARELMLTPEQRKAFVELCDYLGDMVGNCPSCGEQVDRYESDRVVHSRTCKELLADSSR